MVRSEAAAVDADRRVSPARQEKYRAEKQQIVRAAYELIQRDGSKETSVHDVLRAAGLSTRAFYRHFRSRDELVLEMYRVDCDRVNATLAAAVAAAPDPLAALEAWIDQNLAVVYDARRLRHAVVLSSAEVSSAEGFTEVKNAGLAAQRAPLVALLQAGRAQGVFPHADPETDALAIQAVVGAHMRARLDRDPVARTRAEARQRTLDLFRRALGAPA
jgi:AcrR family transcriptional regulator